MQQKIVWLIRIVVAIWILAMLVPVLLARQALPPASWCAQHAAQVWCVELPDLENALSRDVLRFEVLLVAALACLAVAEIWLRRADAR